MPNCTTQFKPWDTVDPNVQFCFSKKKRKIGSSLSNLVAFLASQVPYQPFKVTSVMLSISRVILVCVSFSNTHAIEPNRRGEKRRGEKNIRSVTRAWLIRPSRRLWSLPVHRDPALIGDVDNRSFSFDTRTHEPALVIFPEKWRVNYCVRVFFHRDLS